MADDTATAAALKDKLSQLADEHARVDRQLYLLNGTRKALEDGLKKIKAEMDEVKGIIGSPKPAAEQKGE